MGSFTESSVLASPELNACLEKSLNFRKLKKSSSCFGKRVEGLEKF